MEAQAGAGRVSRISNMQTRGSRQILEEVVDEACLELRVETGRWERMSVGGQQVAVPRHLRYCKMCFREVEDSAHVFFRCPSYRTQRDALAEQACKLATPGARKAMEGCRQSGC